MKNGQGGRWILLVVGVATFALIGAVQAVYGPALPVLARETGGTTAAASLIFSVHWLGCAGGVATMFALGPRMTPRVVLALLAAGAALLGAGLGWGMMLAGAVLAGFGQGCATVLFNPRLLSAFGPRGPAMLSLINAAFGAGSIVAPLIFVLLDGAYGPLFLALALAYLPVLALAQDRGAQAAAAAAPRGFRPDWTILAFGACAIGFEASLIGLGPAALVRAGLDEGTAAEAQSAFFMAFLAARLVLTALAHRVPAFPLLAVSLGGVALTMAGAVILPPQALFIASGAAAALLFPGYFVEAANRMGGDPRVSSVIVAAGMVGGITLPFALARLVDGFGPRGFFLLLALLAGVTAVAALAHMALRRADRKGA